MWRKEEDRIIYCSLSYEKVKQKKLICSEVFICIMWKKLFNLKDDKYGFKTVFQIIVGLLIFVTTMLTASLIVDMLYIHTGLEGPINVLLRCVLEIALFYLVLRFYICRVLKLDLSYFRITKPRFSLLWVITALLLPLAVVLFYFIFIKGTVSYGNRYSTFLNITFALKTALSAGITEELLFRGYIMKLLEDRWNKIIAIFIPSILFASLHIIKGMGSADVILLFIAGTTVGIMFSMVTYQSKTIWNSVIIHFSWNFFILGIFSISSQSNFRLIINYFIKNNNILITGGRFGVEASLPAIVSYVLVIILAVTMNKTSQKQSKTNTLHNCT